MIRFKALFSFIILIIIIMFVWNICYFLHIKTEIAKKNKLNAKKMEKNNFNQSNNEATVGLTVRVPYSFKEKLLDNASRLGITMSELIFDIIHKSGRDNPKMEISNSEVQKLTDEKTALAEQVQNLTYENSSLQRKLSVLESEDNSNGENEEAMEQIEELENEKTELEEQNSTLTEYIEMLQTAYCEIKKAYFINYAYTFYLHHAEKDKNGILEPEHIFYYENKETIISEFESIIEDKEDELSSSDWENIQNVCELDIETNFEVILDKEKRELETDFDEEQALKNSNDSLLKQTKFSSNDERILATLYLANQIQLKTGLFTIPQVKVKVSKEKLKELGFNTGFWSNLSDKGGIYGNYELKRANTNEDYEIIQLKPLVTTNATASIAANSVKTAPEQALTQVSAQVTPATKQPIISKEEGILAKLYETAQKERKIPYLNKEELNILGFDTGFFSKLGVRGAKYGEYELKKEVSDSVFEIIKLKK